MIDLPLAFFGQTFSAGDVPVILLLILLEGLLSADNALVLAIMVRHLPKEQQHKALLYGLAGAFVFRFAAILLASYILGLWWLQMVGAAYLVWVAVKHFATHSNGGHKDVKTGGGFWQTVIAVEITDIAFAVDSVVAAVAMVKGQDKLWVVYAGAIMGVILLRFAAGLFIKLLDKFPDFDHVAYVLVAWVGVKLMFMSGHHFTEQYNETHVPGIISIPEMDIKVFWGVMGLLVVGGTLFALSRGRNKAAITGTPGEAADFSPEPAPGAPESVQAEKQPE
jgi:YkoY family integral membrane protein